MGSGVAAPTVLPTLPFAFLFREAIMDPVPDDAAIERMIFALLDARRPEATVCPSEVARALSPGAAGAWRALMSPVREVAQRLADARRLVVTRRGVPVAATSPGGPIRLGHAARRSRAD